MTQVSQFNEFRKLFGKLNILHKDLWGLNPAKPNAAGEAMMKTVMPMLT